MFLKLKIGILILFANVGIIFSQQMPFSNQYLVNRQYISPAYAGFTGNFEAFISYKKNALHFPGGPEYKSLYASGPVFGNMSLGVSVSKSSVTIFNSFSSQAYYAYHLKVNEKQYIHFGLSFEYGENFLGSDNQSPPAQIDPYIMENGYTLNSGFGLTYTYKTFQIGVAIPRMLGSYIRNSNNQSSYLSSKYSLDRILRGHTSCLFELNNSFSMEPSVIIEKSDSDPLWYNISTLFRIKNITWVEAHYSQGEIMGFSFGANPSKKMLINYTYEFSSSGLVSNSSGIHEISIGFLLGKFNEQKYQKSAFRSLPKQPYYDWIK